MAEWYTDADFVVHADMKSHTGVVLTMGKGDIQTISMKPKISTKCSTEAWLVAANDVLLHFLCTTIFLKQQRYNFDQKLDQYNANVILLETNGMES